MHIDLSELSTREGAKQSIHVRYEGNALGAPGRVFPLISSEESDFEAECTKKGQVHLSGSLAIKVRAVCDRCLVDVPVTVKAVVSEDFDASDLEQEIDIQELLNKEFLLEWPMKILCREDCAGLCSSCGKNLNEGDCGCSRSGLDPRMAAILDVFNQNNGKKEV